MLENVLTEPRHGVVRCRSGLLIFTAASGQCGHSTGQAVRRGRAGDPGLAGHC